MQTMAACISARVSRLSAATSLRIILLVKTLRTEEVNGALSSDMGVKSKTAAIGRAESGTS
jgi:hypothetical protein